MNKIIRVAQKLLLFNDQNQILILKAGDNGKTPKEFIGKWDLPGGGLKTNETLSQSLKREIREELGEINYKNINLIDVTEFTYQSQDGKYYQNVCLMYKAQYLKGKIKISSEHQQFEWVDLKKILEKKFIWPQSNIQFFKKLNKLNSKIL